MDWPSMFQIFLHALHVSLNCHLDYMSFHFIHEEACEHIVCYILNVKLNKSQHAPECVLLLLLFQIFVFLDIYLIIYYSAT